MKPRSRVDLPILAVLEHAPLHAYAIFETIRSYQDDLLGQASHLFPKLQALEDEDYLLRHQEFYGRDIQQVYTITTKGRTYLAQLRQDLTDYQWVQTSVVQVRTSQQFKRQRRGRLPHRRSSPSPDH